MPESNHEIEEYVQLNENLRHYHNQRFAQMTLWLAITAGLLSVLFGEHYAGSAATTVVLKLLGCITSVAF